jgi:hypothetical protein
LRLGCWRLAWWPPPLRIPRLRGTEQSFRLRSAMLVFGDPQSKSLMGAM